MTALAIFPSEEKDAAVAEQQPIGYIAPKSDPTTTTTRRSSSGSSSSAIQPLQNKTMMDEEEKKDDRRQDHPKSVPAVSSSHNDGNNSVSIFNGATHHPGIGGGVQKEQDNDHRNDVVWMWEPKCCRRTSEDINSAAKAVLTPNGLEHIAYHQYTPGDYTILDGILNPIWQFLTETCLPSTMAPNVVTVIGGMHCLLSFTIVWYTNPSLNEKYVSSTTLTMLGILQIMYYTLDCMDGKQARRTHSSTPMGQLLDHGIDCMCLLSHLSTVQSWVCGNLQSFWFMQSFLLFTFYIAQWEEYYTGILPHATGQVGVTEVNYGLACICLLNAFIFPTPHQRYEFYSQPILYDTLQTFMSPDSFDANIETLNVQIFRPYFRTHIQNIELRQILALGWATLMTVLCILSAKRVYNKLSSSERNGSNNNDGLVAVSKLILPAIVLLSPLALSSSSSTEPSIEIDDYDPDILVNRHRRHISTSIGLCVILVTIKLIVFSMAKQAYAIIQLDCIPILVAIVYSRWIINNDNNNNNNNNDIAAFSEWTFHIIWKGLCVWYTYRLHQWTSTACVQICQRLHIDLFRIVPSASSSLSTITKEQSTKKDK